MPCLECSAPLTPSRRGNPRRFCSAQCSKTFENRRRSRGAALYDLFRVMRRERDTAKRLNIWTEMCRLELSWNDRDEGKRTWKPAMMALEDIAYHHPLPTTNLYEKAPK